MNLYELTGALLPLRAALDVAPVDEDGVVTVAPDLLALLDGIEGEYAVKLDACARVVRSLEAEADMVYAEAGRLLKRSEALRSNAERLCEAMRRSLVATGTQTVKGALFTVALRKGALRVDVTSADDLPPDYRRVHPETWAPDKKRIGDALKAGTDVPGATLVQSEPTLSIR